MPINYQNGKVYKIYSLSRPELQYIGSTTQTLAQRLAKHKSNYNDWKRGRRHYVSSFDIFECNDYRIELIELCPCNSKMELHRTEGKYIREEICVNKNVVGRTRKKWYHENKEKINQRRKEYRQANKEKIAQKNKKYYQANREKIAQRDKAKITCECGSVVCKIVMPRHRRSNKHKQFINKQ